MHTGGAHVALSKRVWLAAVVDDLTIAAVGKKGQVFRDVTAAIAIR